MEQIQDCEEGYSTGGEFNGYYFIRLNFGNIQTEKKHIDKYFEKIKKIAIKDRLAMLFE